MAVRGLGARRGAGDAETQLVLACAAESLADEQAFRDDESGGDRLRREAEAALREALTLDPGLTEARLRLGHILLAEGRLAEAEGLLIQAEARAGDDRGRYLARLFLGRTADGSGRPGEAAGFYRRAVEAWPEAQTARLALALLLEPEGRADGGPRASGGDAGRVAAGRPSGRPVVDLPVRAPRPRQGRARPAVEGARAMSGLVAGALLAGAVLQGPPVFRAEVDLVRVEVLVTRGGVPVRGLGAADFEVRDNGRLQALEPTLEAEAPVDAVLALDTSYSMVGAKLVALREAAGSFLDGLRDGERAALIAFNEEVRLLEPLSPDLDRVRRALDGAGAGGRTAIVDAVYTALRSTEPSARRTAVVVFSDGLDNMSWLSAAEVIEAARRTEAIVYGVAVRGRGRPHAALPPGRHPGHRRALLPGRGSGRPSAAVPRRARRHPRPLRAELHSRSGRPPAGMPSTSGSSGSRATCSPGPATGAARPLPEVPSLRAHCTNSVRNGDSGGARTGQGSLPPRCAHRRVRSPPAAVCSARRR